MKISKNNFYALLASILLFSFCNNDNGDGDAAQAEKISASALMQKFETNLDKAQKKYLGKAVQIDGEILEISNNSLGNIVFGIKTKNKSGAQILCNMLADDMKYEPGDKVVIKGFCQDYKFNLLLDKCITVSED